MWPLRGEISGLEGGGAKGVRVATHEAAVRGSGCPAGSRRFLGHMPQNRRLLAGSTANPFRTASLTAHRRETRPRAAPALNAERNDGATDRVCSASIRRRSSSVRPTPRIVVVAKPLPRVVQLAVHQLVDRVVLLGPVVRQCHNVTGLLIPQRLIRHPRLLSPSPNQTGLRAPPPAGTRTAMIPDLSARARQGPAPVSARRRPAGRGGRRALRTGRASPPGAAGRGSLRRRVDEERSRPANRSAPPAR